MDEFEAAKRIAFALNSAIDRVNRLGTDTSPFELLPMLGWVRSKKTSTPTPPCKGRGKTAPHLFRSLHDVNLRTLIFPIVYLHCL